MLTGRSQSIIAACLLLAGVANCQMYEDYDVPRNAKLPPRRPLRTQEPKVVLINNRANITRRPGKSHAEGSTRARNKPQDLWLGNIALVAPPTRTSVPIATLSQRRRSFKPLRDVILISTESAPRNYVASAKTVAPHDSTVAAGSIHLWKSILRGGDLPRAAKTTSGAVNVAIAPQDDGIEAAQIYSRSWLRGKANNDTPKPYVVSNPWLRDNEKDSDDGKEGSKDDKEESKDEKEGSKGDIEGSQNNKEVPKDEERPRDNKEGSKDDTEGSQVNKEVPKDEEHPRDNKEGSKDDKDGSKGDKKDSNYDKEGSKENIEATPDGTTLAPAATVKPKKSFPLAWAYAIAGAGAIAMTLLLSAILGMMTTVYGTHRKCKKSVSCPCAVGKTFKSLRFTCGNVQTGKPTAIARTGPAAVAPNQSKRDKRSADVVAAKGSARPASEHPRFRGYSEQDGDGRIYKMAARSDLGLNAAPEYPRYAKDYCELDGDSRNHKMAARNDLAYEHERTAASQYPRYGKGYSEMDGNYRAQQMPGRNDLAFENQRSAPSNRESNNDPRFAPVDCFCECECPEVTGASVPTRSVKRMHRADRDSRSHKMAARDGYEDAERTAVSRRSRSVKGKKKSVRNSSSESAGKQGTSKRSRSAKGKKKSTRNSSSDSAGKKDASKRSRRSHSAKDKKKMARNSSNESAEKKDPSKSTRSSKGEKESPRDSVDESTSAQDDLEPEDPEPTAAAKKHRSKRKGKVDMMCECPEPSGNRPRKRKGTSTRVMCCTDTILVPNDALFKCPDVRAALETRPPSKNGDSLLGDEESHPAFGDCNADSRNCNRQIIDC